LQYTCWRPRPSCDGHSNRLLLAQFARECHDTSADLRQVPEVRAHPTSALHSHDVDYQFPTIRYLGNVDILGPFPKATGQRKHLFVAMVYFTKWIEAEAIASITTAELRRFIWRSIITAFGVPHAIIFDNGRQFDTNRLIDYLNNLGYQAQFTTIADPQTNSQAEAANKSILHGLQKKLDDANRKWETNCTASYGPSTPPKKPLLVTLPRLSYPWKSPSTVIGQQLFRKS